MSDDDKKFDKCKAIDHPNLMPGWGCCKCRTYNGNQRVECKQCQHERCDIPAAPSESDDEASSNWEIN
jgi:hypothetical protein